MSDAAAVSLGEWFLSDLPDRSIETLIETLRTDPPLALWAVLKADRLPSSPPQCIADLAGLLAEHGLAWLQWEADSTTIEVDPSLSQEFAARAAVGVMISERAAELAAAKGDTARHQAQFLGLLQDANQWLTELNRPVSARSSIQLPKWLAPSRFDPAAADAVEQAISSLDIAASPPAVPGALSEKSTASSACIRRGAEAASFWAADHRAARCLKALMAKLAKLAALEGSFHAAVEAEKIAAMAEFAAGAGHEINNPLAVIAGRAQLLLQDEVDPERRRDLALVNTQAMRVNEMIADLRLFATPPELELQPLNLAALVRRLIDDLQTLAVGQETGLHYAEASCVIPIMGDPVQLSVAVRSLCQNALEALGVGGQIEIEVRSDGTEALLTVADDGPGILPEQQPHLFEPFYSARQAGRGVGMGLSKCWRIVNQHGGRIEFSRRAGSGAVFIIRLPLA